MSVQTQTALDLVLDRLRDHGCAPKRSGGHYAARCPAHDDRSPSLSVGPADQFNGAVVKCHTGCRTEQIVEALGLSARDLFDDASDRHRGSVEVARYPYTTFEGEVLFEKVRRFPKDFRVTPAGVVGKLASVPLYRLAEVAHAITAGTTVHVVEGEKDADRLVSLGLVATTNYEGAAKPDQRAKWRREYADQLAGAHVVVVADNDDPGRAHASHWAAQLRAGRCKSVRLVVPTRGKDVSDHLDAGGTLEELAPLASDDAPDDPEAEATAEQTRERLVSGGTFILDTPAHVPALWGSGTGVVWAEGEALVVAGPSGVGKTTVAGQLVRGLVVGGEVLGMPVQRRRRVLYLAMDRPRQAARALRRTLGDLPREVLDEHLTFWKGPPLTDVAKHPDTLLDLVHAADADVLVVDSVKDAAVGLSDDEVGAGYNRARQLVIGAGVDVLELHHLVKRGASGGPPTALADLYGSVWITAGAGSVVLLWGAAGDPIVEFKHLKQPAEEVGPFKLLHDHEAGVSTVWNTADLVLMAQRPGGVTKRDAAVALFEKEKPTPAELEKAARRLRKLAREGPLEEVPGDEATATPTRWVRTPLTTLTDTLTAPENREALTTPSRPSRVTEEPQVSTLTDTLTTLTEADPHVFPPACKAGEAWGGLCEDCGEALSDQRVVYGKQTCVECEEAS